MIYLVLFIYYLPPISFPVQSRHLNEESKTHIHLLDKTETEMSVETLALRAEAVRAETMRKGQVQEIF